jgi:hypothetical protein
MKSTIYKHPWFLGYWFIIILSTYSVSLVPYVGFIAVFLIVLSVWLGGYPKSKEWNKLEKFRSAQWFLQGINVYSFAAFHFMEGDVNVGLLILLYLVPGLYLERIVTKGES